MSVGGVIIPDKGYISQSYKHVREAGGVCIADEVQTGFGRLGDKYYWAYQQAGPEGVPDIVTCGKPFGNGMPLAAVVCTDAVSAAFASTGIEYFNTFGGNPVCCAAGLTVMEVLEEEGLRHNAQTVGDFIQTVVRNDFMIGRTGPPSLSSCAAGSGRPGLNPHCYVGDVRGCGLFIGIELVKMKARRGEGGNAMETVEAATAETSLVCSRLKAAPYHILTSVDGPEDNVIVLKPPMCFSMNDARRFLSALATVLEEVTAEDANAKRTPT
jgi:4-aminobutyrate aminotransferase-like enzyme